MKICNKWLLHRSSYYILQYGNAGNINQGLKQPQSFSHTNTHGRSYAHMHKSLHWISNHTKDGDERVAICLKGYLIVSPYFQRIQSFSSFPSPISLSLFLPKLISSKMNETILNWVDCGSMTWYSDWLYLGGNVEPSSKPTQFSIWSLLISIVFSCSWLYWCLTAAKIASFRSLLAWITTIAWMNAAAVAADKRQHQRHFDIEGVCTTASIHDTALP